MTRTVTLRPGGTSPLYDDTRETIVDDDETPITLTPTAVHHTSATPAGGPNTVEDP